MSLVEQIEYDLILNEDAMEIRKYKGFNIAEVEKTRESSFDTGFNNIFRYIRGENNASQKISMTAPVLSEMEDDAIKTSFVMPSDLSLEDLPQPLDDRVIIRHVPEGVYGAIGFTGSWKREKFLNMSERLKLWIERNAYKIISNAIVARYNPPITPSFLRKNEILFRVESRIK